VYCASAGNDRHVLLTLCVGDRTVHHSSFLIILRVRGSFSRFVPVLFSVRTQGCGFQDRKHQLHTSLDFLEEDLRVFAATWADQLVMAPPEWSCPESMCRFKNVTIERKCKYCSTPRPEHFHVCGRTSITFPPSPKELAPSSAPLESVFNGPEWAVSARHYRRRPVSPVEAHPGPAISTVLFVDLRGMHEDAVRFWNLVVPSGANLWRIAELPSRPRAMNVAQFVETICSFLYDDRVVFRDLRQASGFSRNGPFADGNMYTEGLSSSV
jgi:hypothetical protein